MRGAVPAGAIDEENAMYGFALMGALSSALILISLDVAGQQKYPDKGSGPVMNALLAAEVQSSFSSLVPSIPHVKDARITIR